MSASHFVANLENHGLLQFMKVLDTSMFLDIATPVELFPVEKLLQLRSGLKYDQFDVYMTEISILMKQFKLLSLPSKIQKYAMN